MLERIESGETKLVVGTHALIEDPGEISQSWGSRLSTSSIASACCSASG